MANKKSTPKPFIETIEKQTEAVVNQLKGLQSFLKALGEAASHDAVVDT
jgi:hypothetical protein